jgi:N-methylhydantoinase A
LISCRHLGKIGFCERGQQMSWVIGVDVGGTFTDFFAFDDTTDRIVLHKVASTPGNPAQAVISGLRELGARHGIDLDAIVRLSHGTTVATNALIQRRGGKVALVVTEGFRDLIEIGRQIRPHVFSLQADYPPPLVPRELRFEASERVTADGKALRALDPDTLPALVKAIGDAKPDACAVCLLFSFLNPAHEAMLRDALSAAYPDMYLSISSEVQPEFREYERLSTTVLNAYLQPVIDRYLADFQEGVSAAAPRAALGINQSSGGLMSVARARHMPIRTALSGPAAGAVGAIHMARLSGVPDVISLDMGGTSADVALMRNYTAGTTFNKWIEGYPARLASVDINAVGAGGGSIAWFDRDGLMKVGPQSAGALPGPACYGRGGEAATVTDANLVLGRLSPRGLLNGEMSLDVNLARKAIAPFAERLVFSVERTAHGMLGIVVANMVRAIRTVSVERGHDPRAFALLPFGGAGPLHATDVAKSLGITRCLVPFAPGILCAQGLIVSDLRETFVRTAVTPLNDARLADVIARVAELKVQAGAWFDAEGVDAANRTIDVVLDARYVGQNFELAIGLGGSTPLPSADDIRQRFFTEHERAYGFHNPADPVEIVNFRLIAAGKLRQPASRPTEPRKSGAPQAASRRKVWFTADAAEDTPVYDRATLLPGDTIAGPAVIEQLDSTTLLFPGDRATVDPYLNLMVEISP